MVNRRSKAYLRTRLKPQIDDLKWKTSNLFSWIFSLYRKLPFGISSAKICPVKAKIVKNFIFSRIVEFQRIQNIKNIFNKVLFGLEILEL